MSARSGTDTTGRVPRDGGDPPPSAGGRRVVVGFGPGLARAGPLSVAQPPAGITARRVTLTHPTPPRRRAVSSPLRTPTVVRRGTGPAALSPPEAGLTTHQGRARDPHRATPTPTPKKPRTRTPRAPKTPTRTTGMHSPRPTSILKTRKGARRATPGHRKRVRFGRKDTYFIPVKEDTRTYMYHKLPPA